MQNIKVENWKIEGLSLVCTNIICVVCNFSVGAKKNRDRPYIF